MCSVNGTLFKCWIVVMLSFVYANSDDQLAYNEIQLPGLRAAMEQRKMNVLSLVLLINKIT